MQTKTQSLVESVTNVVIGYFVALLSQLLVFPMFGIHVSFGDNIAIGLWFTAISVIRSYVVRRWFNKKEDIPGGVVSAASYISDTKLAHDHALRWVLGQLDEDIVCEDGTCVTHSRSGMALRSIIEAKLRQ